MLNLFIEEIIVLFGFSSSSEMCKNILETTGVVLLPGSDFGFDKKEC